MEWIIENWQWLVLLFIGIGILIAISWAVFRIVKKKNEKKTEIKTEEQETNTDQKEKDDRAYRKKWLPWYVIGIVVLAIIVIIIYSSALSIYTNKAETINWIFSCITIGLIALFIAKSANIIRANEIAVRLLFGRPVEKDIKSGLKWTMWPIEIMVRFTREIMEFHFMAKSIITRRGLLLGYDKPIEPADINLRCTLYAQFDETKLDQTIENSPGNNAESIGSFLVPYVTDAIRALGGRLPWRLINQERRYFADWVLARLIGGKYHGIRDKDAKKCIEFITEKKDGETFELTPEEDEQGLITSEEKGRGVRLLHPEKLKSLSPFVIIGLKNVSFALEDLNFTKKDLADSISKPEQARLEATATITTAEAERVKRSEEGQGDAEARGAMLAEINKHPELEAISAIKELGKGPSNFIFPLPEAFVKTITEMFMPKRNQKNI